MLFGPPGAGKGTQAQLLAEQLKVSHIGSGDLFRHHLQQGTPLGLRASEFMNRGVLVPDEVTIDIILDKVLSLNSEDGFILDGFPRNRNQAEVLEDALTRRARGLDKVVYIQVPEPELVKRLAGRFSCRQCQVPHSIPNESSGPEGSAPDLTCQRCGGELYQRPDDTPKAVQKRIQVYKDETLPVLSFYQNLGILAEVAGVDNIESVNQRVLEALGVPEASPVPEATGC